MATVTKTTAQPTPVAKAKPTFAQLRAQEVKRKAQDFVMGTPNNPAFTADERALFAEALEVAAKFVRNWQD